MRLKTARRPLTSAPLPLFDYFLEPAAPIVKPKPRFRSVELFAGAGGLGLGLAQAGFHHEIVVERDETACDTLRLNQKAGHDLVKDWNIVQVDVRDVDLSGVQSGIDLLAGGPPCQPFSIGGKHRGHEDDRDMWPWTIRATRTLKPRAFLFENVRNLASKFSDYLEYIKLQLAFPELIIWDDESTEQHRDRLRRYATEGRPDGLHYRVESVVVDAADYGVPQFRERVLIVGMRGDITSDWTAPVPTHSQSALDIAQWVTGEYWDRHRINDRRPDEAALRRVRKHNSAPPADRYLQPHRTLRDAIADLPAPGAVDPAGITGHTAPPREARAYKGHTGSPLDKPSKALRAGDHGVSGGENMIDYGDGSYRHFTTREAARLQTFPDDYRFAGSWGDTLRQLGNAVPSELSRAFGVSIGDALAH